MKSKINTTLTAEARAILGDPVFVPYALMGTVELATAAESLVKSDILLLENHGILQQGPLYCRHSIKLKYLKMLLK